MLHPRLGFRLLVVASLFVGVVAVGGGLLRGALGLLGALALALAARERLGAPAPRAASFPERIPRHTIAAGAATIVLGAAWLVGGVGWAALATLLLGSMVVAEGAQLSLEAAPVPTAVPLDSTRSVALTAAIAADELLRVAWDRGGRITPRTGPVRLAGLLRDVAERNRARGWLDDPALAHPPPPGLEKPSLRRRELRGVGAALEIAFESEFEPFDPEVRDAYLAVAQNRRARALWLRGDAPRPTLLCIHGYGGGRAAFDARVFDVAGLRRRLDVDVLLFVLPLHGARAPGRRSGAGFLDEDPLWTNAALAQAVWELRRLAGWLRGEGAPAVGVQGGSLGGYTTALLASLDGGLACAVPWVPAVAMARLVWRALPAARRVALEAAGASVGLLDETYASHAPLRHRPRVAPEGRLLVAGAADRICPAADVLALAEHWGGAPIHWFPGTHLGPRGRRATREVVEAHLRRTLCEGAGDASVPLSRFRFPAPTGDPEPPSS